MSANVRKILGIVLMLVFLIVYSLLAMAVAMVLQVYQNRWIELVYYITAGLAWVPPAAWIIWWMQRPPGGRAKA